MTEIIGKFKSIPIKIWMIIFLSILALAGISQQGYTAKLLLQLMIVIGFCVILDSAINYFKTKRVIFPDSSIISGLLIASILGPHQSRWIYIFAVLAAILSKHLIKFKGRHIFNPANFGLLAVSFFGATLIWWGLSNLILVILFGAFIAYKLKRIELVISNLIFLGGLFFVYGLIKGKNPVDYISLVNFYFVFFMLTEPKTGAQTSFGRIIFSGLVAVFSFIAFLTKIGYDYSVVGLAAANMFVPAINKRGHKL